MRAECPTIGGARESVETARIHAWTTRSLLQRLTGALFLPELPRQHGVYLPNRRWCHTFFMRFNLDLVGMAGDGVVETIRYNVKPCQLIVFPLRCTHILELMAGEAQRLLLQCGFMILIEPCPRTRLRTP